MKMYCEFNEKESEEYLSQKGLTELNKKMLTTVQTDDNQVLQRMMNF